MSTHKIGVLEIQRALLCSFRRDEHCRFLQASPIATVQHAYCEVFLFFSLNLIHFIICCASRQSHWYSKESGDVVGKNSNPGEPFSVPPTCDVVKTLATTNTFTFMLCKVWSKSILVLANTVSTISELTPCNTNKIRSNRQLHRMNCVPLTSLLYTMLIAYVQRIPSLDTLFLNFLHHVFGQELQREGCDAARYNRLSWGEGRRGGCRRSSSPPTYS